MSDLNWLLVGPGDISRKRAAPALAQAEGSRIAGIVYHTRKEQAEAMAAEHGADAVYDDFTAALEQSDANAVYLATPVFLHTPQAVAALESGRHVLVEKPLALNAADAQPMLDAVAQTGLKAACAFYRRFFPRFAHAKGMIDAGELGTIVLARVICHSWYDPAPDDPKRWRIDRAKSGGGALADMGSHLLDLLTGLLGAPETVFARCDNLVHPDWSVEDSCSALATLPGGAHITASVSWNSKTWRQEVEIVGTEARITWLPSDTGPVTVTRGRDIEELEMPNADNVHLPLVQDFVDAVREDRDPFITVHEAAKTTRLIDAIYRSADTGRPVAVSSLP